MGAASSSPSGSLPASPRSPRQAPDEHGAQGASAPMEMEMEDSEMRAPLPAAPAAPLQQPGRRLKIQPKYTVQGIFRRFTMRRVALIRALTIDEEAFFQKCEPGMQALCLYGNTDGSWEVKPPELYVPPSEPEPASGINIARDKMKRHEWLQDVAMHCDVWLINISFYYGSRLTVEQRRRVFTMINSLPTVQETFLPSDTYQRIRHLEERRSSSPVQENQEEEDALPGEDKNFCATCGDRYHANGFWIGCHECGRWYHGKCVKIKASEAKNIDRYECPECRLDKLGHDYDDDPVLSDLFKRYY